ncbi:triphosphoribosyl-dephospho-CoA synthase [Streptomyces cupreus]|uniref:triphosphoribosyl-dephospho-CoA synthase n=1 Tax=Streptomyces cupreus TaxID=2759956 RepID=A0A7X1M931_9ACTN|nr:triphosphoribosyl-dephospho-CoA synthase [Streptomyces cupreus]MBC2902829.1 triphosphoribosyl-dephospho-CoA synthase [Streptomyces cupreus]
MTSREDEALARAAVTALTDQLALTPKPGLPDPSHRDHNTLRWSAKALTPGLAAMSAAARRTGEPTPGLRAELGAIGRCTEHSVGLAGGGHRGALWTLGLLVAAAAIEPREVPATAKRIAAHPDRGAPRRPSRGSSMSAKYGAAGARGEARAGFPHIRRAWAVLADGTPRPQSRLNALLTIMSTLQDTELLYTAGPTGLRHVQAGARRVLEAGGTGTAAGAKALTALDTDLHNRGWSPRGSAGLMAGALFLDALPATAQPAGTRTPVRGTAARRATGSIA